MRYLKICLFLVFALTSHACAEEGFVKIFKCPDSKPFLNTYNNKCYTSEEAAEEANKHYINTSEDADNDAETDAEGDGVDNGESSGTP